MPLVDNHRLTLTPSDRNNIDVLSWKHSRSVGWRPLSTGPTPRRKRHEMSQPNGWALRRAGWAPDARGRVAAAVAGLVVTAGVATVTFAPTANAASGCQVSYTT